MKPEAAHKKGFKKPAPVSAALEKRLLSYAAAASAAGVGMLALAQPAEARIVYKPAHVKILDSSHYLVLNGDGIPNFLISNAYFTSPGSGGLQAQLLVEAVGRKSFVETSASSRILAAAALEPGAKIPPAHGSHGFKAGGFMLRFTLEIPGGSTYLGKWREAKDRFLGLKFQQSGKTHYGWARFNMTDNRLCAAILTGYAYETVPNKPIIAGKTEGPSDRQNDQLQPVTLGHLARGSSAIASWRVQRTAATAP
jgi:hypothetical protein